MQHLLLSLHGVLGAKKTGKQVKTRMRIRRRESGLLLLASSSAAYLLFFKRLFWTDKVVILPTEDVKEMILATKFSYLKYSPSTFSPIQIYLVVSKYFV